MPLRPTTHEHCAVTLAEPRMLRLLTACAAAIEKQGADEGSACKNFWIVDAKGLITDERPALSDVVQPFARCTGDGGCDVDREQLLDVVKRVPPARSSP